MIQNMKWNIKRLIILILFVGSADFVVADSIGTLSLEKGTIRIRRTMVDQFYSEPSTKIAILNKDEIQTGFNTSAKLILKAKKDIIELFSNTFFKVSNISEKTDDVRMPIGKARFSINKSKRRLKKRRFRIKTANASINVKGTEFVIGSHEGSTNLLTISGIVTMANINTPEIVVEVKMNQVSQIRPNAQPTLPVVVPPKVKQVILTTDSPKAFQETKFGDEIKPTVTKPEKKSSSSIKPENGKEGNEKESGLQTSSPTTTSVSDKDSDELAENEEVPQIDENLDGDLGLEEDLDVAENIIDEIAEVEETIDAAVEATEDIETVKTIDITVTNP